MAPIIFKTTITKNQSLSHNVKEMVCKLEEPEQIDFQTGQFMMFQIPDSEGKIIRRAYSIASLPDDKNNLTFCYKIVEDGQLTPILGELKEGNELTMQGPLGHFFIKAEADTEEFIFVATGTGIAPMNAFIPQLLQSGDARKMRLYFCVRNEEDIIYQDFYEKLAEEYENFEFIFSLSRPNGKEWGGCVGRVTHMIEDTVSDASAAEVYLCGNGDMITEVKELMIKKGAKEEKLVSERYY